MTKREILTFQRIGLLSLYGGLSGGVSSLLSYILTNFLLPVSLLWVSLIPAVCFSVAGASVGFSLTLAEDYFVKHKNRIIMCGTIGGIFFGIIVGFGVIGYYIAPLSLCLLLGIGAKKTKIIIGAFLGTFLSFVVVVLMIILVFLIKRPMLENQDFSELIGFLVQPFSLYLLNFGAIFSLRLRPAGQATASDTAFL